MALQHNLRFPSGAPMLSFAWHAERQPSSGLLDIFSHALLSRSCERNLSGGDAAAAPAWMQGALAAVPCCSHGLWPHPARELPSRIPRCIPGQLPRRAAEPRGRITAQTLLLLNNAHGSVCASSSPQGGALGKGTVFSQKRAKGGEKNTLKTLITLQLYSVRTRVGVCVGTVLAEDKLH